VIRLPIEISQTLPSRGLSMGLIRINSQERIAPFEPDGEGSHWFFAGTAAEGVELEVEIELAESWPEPRLPDDVSQILNADPSVWAIWQTLTVAARWEWVRWAQAPKGAETRARRVESMPSRLMAGKRRPCCFDHRQRTLTDA
jgi:hypothetical protein